jgi:ParB family chromosome partitioning protein
MNYQNIALSRIDSENDTCRISTEKCGDSLRDSIRNLGLMNPPTLIEEPASAGFVTVTGFRRIAACRELRWSEIPAKILPPETEKLHCVKLAITDNVSARALNLIETSRALHSLSEFFENDRRLAQEASVLGLPQSPSLIGKIRKLCLLPQPIQDGILSDTIPLAVASELGEMESETALVYARLFETLKPSLSKQREILTLVREIARREDMTVLNVLESDAFQEILCRKESDRNQKTRDIRRYLRQRRFPAVTRAEQSFETGVKSLNLGKDMKLIPPENFEDTVYTLHLNFRNFSELKAQQAKLENIIRNPSLKKIFEPEI